MNIELYQEPMSLACSLPVENMLQTNGLWMLLTKGCISMNAWHDIIAMCTGKLNVETILLVCIVVHRGGIPQFEKQEFTLHPKMRNIKKNAASEVKTKFCVSDSSGKPFLSFRLTRRSDIRADKLPRPNHQLSGGLARSYQHDGWHPPRCDNARDFNRDGEEH